jgi:oxygen-independent coproporphyrinogen-3 oxidase
MPDGYAQNDASVRFWRHSIETGRLATVRGVPLSAEDKSRRMLIEAILCSLSADLADLPPREMREMNSTLVEMEEDGIVSMKGTMLRVTERGRPFLRAVCSLFDPYFKRAVAAQRHSLAI